MRYKQVFLAGRWYWEVTHFIDKDPSQLIGDHIVPIALGGDEWDIENIQTLCSDCNKEKTRQDAADIAQLRKKESLQAAGQTFL